MAQRVGDCSATYLCSLGQITSLSSCVFVNQWR
jgi:hypothetical protein